MGNYRQIHTKIWKDGWFLELPPDRKLLFIYLFSNEGANLTGLYELPLKAIAFETGLDFATIEQALRDFAEAGKAFYEDGWIWVRSLLRYNARNIASEKIQAHIANALAELPEIPLKARALAFYSDTIGSLCPAGPPDTVSIPNPTEQEEETEQEPEQENAQEQRGIVADTHPRDVPAQRAFLAGLGVGTPKLDRLTQSAWITADYARSWWHYIDTWNVDRSVKVASLITRMEQRRMPPPEYRGHSP